MDFGYTPQVSGNDAAILTADLFEDSMEKSFLYWLQNEIDKISVTGKRGDIIETLDIPVEVVYCMPYEYYEKKRGDYAIIDVNFASVNTDGYHLGLSLGNENATDEAGRFRERIMPWMYDLEITLNTFTSSAIARTKLDGTLRHLLEGTRRGYKFCPVYQWEVDTASVSAYTTGSYVTVKEAKRVGTSHSSDEKNYDFLSHWTIDARCPYILDTVTDLVSSFDITNDILSLF